MNISIMIFPILTIVFILLIFVKKSNPGEKHPKTFHHHHSNQRTYKNGKLIDGPEFDRLFKNFDNYFK